MGILLLSIILNTWNNDFNGSYHHDEKKKVLFISENYQDFNHPILMLAVPRVLNIFFNYTQFDDILRLGRTTTAVFGTLLVLLFFFIVRRFLSSPFDLLSTLVLASSPIIVIHSHFLKEDIIFTFFGFLSLYSFFYFLDNPSRKHILLFGIATGLAFSAKYIALFLLPVYISGIMLSERKDKKQLFLDFLKVFGIAFIVFVIVNYPLIMDYPVFSRGFRSELRHSIRGHKLYISPIAHYFSFHLIKSIIPGITLMVALPALISLFYFLYKWKILKIEEKIWLVFTVAYYFIVESSPVKPWSGYIRYILPVIPGLIYFLYKMFEYGMHHWYFKSIKMMLMVCIGLSIILPLQMSLKLDYYLIRDTRNKAMKYLKATGKNAFIEEYAGEWASGRAIDHDINALKNEGISDVAVSSFNYGRYEYGASLKNQSADVYKNNQAYQDLLQYPYIEIKPDYMTFSMSNPTIRIINIADGKK